MKRRRKLYAVLDAHGEVLGGAPFDAFSLPEAKRQVMDTLGLAVGERVVRLTKKLEQAYRRRWLASSSDR